MKNPKSKYLAMATVAIAAIGSALLFRPGRTIPKGIRAITNFKKEKYLGLWYEIARFDYRFEKNMNNVTANYSLKENGMIRVVNRGYDYVKNKHKQSEGKARFATTGDIGMLEVSFFGPFYSGYNIIAIDDDYKYALVSGETRDYLWLLSREKTMPDAIKNQYTRQAADLGFKVEELIWVTHD